MTLSAETAGRIRALADRRSKSPSHVELLRSAVVDELESWARRNPIDPMNLLVAIERYDDVKGGR